MAETISLKVTVAGTQEMVNLKSKLRQPTDMQTCRRRNIATAAGPDQNEETTSLETETETDTETETKT